MVETGEQMSDKGNNNQNLEKIIEKLSNFNMVKTG